MTYRRIIPCLDIKDGRVVKGVQFLNLRDAGDAVESAIAYDKAGADELCLLDITATHDNRAIIVGLVTEVARHLTVPFTVGGGIRSIEDIRGILRAGADKVSINSAAVTNPKLIEDAAQTFGRQCLVAAIDAKRAGETAEGHPRFEIYTAGGRHATGIDAVDYARQITACGAGELLVTSMDEDGAKGGYDLELLQAITRAVSVPVIASGGVGTLDHFVKGATVGGAQGLLAASVFHFGELTISDVKHALHNAGVAVRPPLGSTMAPKAASPQQHQPQPQPTLISNPAEGTTVSESSEAEPTAPTAAPLGEILALLGDRIASRARTSNPSMSYTASLLNKGITKVSQKVGEEAVETVIAALAEDNAHLAEESADLLYHLLVLWQARGLHPDVVATVLKRRSGVTG
ncbi:MAG: imidazole glycerol phosphate synthase subunit HisF [Alphaproteobacteria bacterium]|nr:imidazole glycerol phosphate synthase subunit HisF [Alphaproteobacteria bacterium]